MKLKDEDMNDAQSEEEKDSDIDEEEKGKFEETPAAAMLRSMIEDDMVKGALKLKSNFTIVVNNLPTSTKEFEVKALFSKYGKIVSVCFRRNCTTKAYVRFLLKKDMKNALEMNGFLVNQHRISVNRTNLRYNDASCTIHVKHFPQDIKKPELYQFFERAGPIDFMKIFWQSQTAYISFKKAVSTVKAIKLNGELLKGQPVEVLRLDVNGDKVLYNPTSRSITET